MMLLGIKFFVQSLQYLTNHGLPDTAGHGTEEAHAQQERHDALQQNQPKPFTLSLLFDCMASRYGMMMILKFPKISKNLLLRLLK